jgi:hypothetical protein
MLTRPEEYSTINHNAAQPTHTDASQLSPTNHHPKTTPHPTPPSTVEHLLLCSIAKTSFRKEL